MFILTKKDAYGLCGFSIVVGFCWCVLEMSFLVAGMAGKMPEMHFWLILDLTF